MRWLTRILPARGSGEAEGLVANRMAAAHAASERQDYETARAGMLAEMPLPEPVA